MAHEIEGNNAFFVGEKAWHGLGTMFPREAPPQTAREAIIAAGADWEVNLFPMMAQLSEEDQIEVPGQFAVVRDIDERVVGTVGSKYVPLQNIEAFNFFNPFIRDGQATFEAGGVLQEGKRVWVLAKINEGADGEVINGDAVETYLCLYNSHDGSTSVGVLFTPIRVVCQNTLSAATQGFRGTNIVKISHTASMHRSLDLVQQTIDTARKTFTVTLEQYRQMQDKKMDIEGLAQYAAAAIIPETKSIDMEDLPRVVKKTIEFYHEGPGQNLPGVRGTLWGAYNAVTGFVDHVRGRNPDSRMDASLFGVGAKIRTRAHNLALDLVAGKI